MFKKLDSFFGISKRKSSFRIEIIGGITTFLAMAYILFVNPDILSAAGMDLGAIFVATALIAGIGTIAMGLVAKLPVAIAPGMGLNAFFAFSIVLGMGHSWQYALAAVFVSGILYLIITLTGLRTKVVNAIPQSLKYAIGAGIGFFIAYLGLANAGIVVAGGAITELGNLSDPTVLLALFGIIFTFILLALKVKASVFFGLIGTAILGLILGLLGVVNMPAYSGIVSAIPSISPTFGAGFSGMIDVIIQPTGWFIIFAFLFVDFFDTSGTLMAVTSQMEGVTDAEIQKANIVDSSATVVGAVLGTSTATTFVESLSGIGAGARTGFASIITGLLFLLALFFSPLMTLITPAVTAAALVVVGTMMAKSIGKIEWDNWQIGVASFITILMMVLTYSISNGIGFGFLFYVIAMVASGKAKEISPLLYAVVAFFMAYLAFITFG